MSNNTTVPFIPAPAPCVDTLMIDPNTAPDIVLNILLFMGLAAACNAQEMMVLFKQPKQMVITIFFQYGVMPLLAYIFAMIGDFPANFKIAFIITLSAPGGAISNMIAALFQADMNLSIGVTGISCLLAIGLMPLNQYIYIVGANMLGPNNTVCVKFLGIVWAAFTVLLGICIGISLKYLFQKKRLYRGIKLLYLIGAVAGLTITFKGFAGNASSSIPWWLLPADKLVCIVAPGFIGPILVWIVGTLFRIPGPQRLTMFLEVGIQNLPVAMAAIMFVLPLQQAYSALTVPMAYQMVAMIFLFIMSFIAYKLGYTYLDKNKNFISAWREGAAERAERSRKELYGDDKEAADADRRRAGVAVDGDADGSQDADADAATADKLESGKPNSNTAVASVAH